MADKTIGQLVAAPSNIAEYTGQELFVLEQNNTAKKLTMQILENWLVSFADGHGGIQTISKTGTSGLVDTYTITFADQSTATFTVTNGNGITGVTQYWAVSSSNTTVPSSWSTTRQTMTPTNKYLWSYMTFARDSGSFSTTKSVVGVYGDTGQAWYVWIKYAGVQPTSDADMGDTPDNWMGVYSGTKVTAPTSYTAYQWFEIKGETGNTGATGASIASVTRTGGTGEPGSTDTYTITLDTGTVAGTFTVYNGLNGSGAVATVNNVQPDGNGNVQINASNISTSGGQDVQAVLSSYWTSIQAAQSTASDAQTAANAAQTTANGKAPISHASTATTYGAGNASNYGHLKLSNSPNASQGTSSGVAATPAAVQTAIDAGKWKLLWTNASPSSAFAAQTISINLSQYSEVRVVVKQATGANVFLNFIGFVGYDLYADIIGTFNSGAIMMLNRRQMTISTSGIAVIEGRKKSFNATTYTVDNDQVIPYQIYAR